MKKLSLLFLILAFVGVIILLQNIFFEDEFVHVIIEKTDEHLTVVKDPEGWDKDELSLFTSIQATFRNTTDHSCRVTLSPANDDESFDIESSKEFGALLPKVDVVHITFCDEQVAVEL